MADSARSDGDGDGQNQPPQGDVVKWLAACHDTVANLNANLDTVTVLLKNILGDLTNLVGLMDGRPAGLGKLSGSEGSADSGG